MEPEKISKVFVFYWYFLTKTMFFSLDLVILVGVNTRDAIFVNME